LRTALIILVAFVVLAAVALVAYLVAPFKRIDVTVLPDSETIVTQIRTMANVETVSYSLEKVISYDQDANSIWRFLGNHTKLFVVHGDVIAGIDLSRVSKNDVIIQGKSITVNLPPPQILVTTLDESKMRVYNVNTGLYGLWNEGIDPNTVLQIEAEAKKSLQADACQEGILQKASDSARAQFTSFFKTMGFTSVTINIPSGRC
jgi:hypothetical protein